MANGVQLATAYISLNVRTDDIKKQVSAAFADGAKAGRSAGASMGSHIAQGLKNAFGGGAFATAIFAPMEVAGIRWAVKAGSAIGGALKKAIMGAVGGLGLGALFGVGGVLTAGLDRLKTLQQSTVQLSLKLKPEDIKNLQKQISDVVTGTPISLDKAMQAVPAAINAGLRGDAVKQYIKDIADLTASTGGQGQFDQLAVILGQIRSKGKLAGDELQQLVNAGVDVRGILKDAFGWDDKTLEKNLAKNKVGINELQKAIQKSFGSTAAGGLAKEMGKTFDGAIGSLKASAARLGANFIAAVLGKQANEDPLKDYAEGINRITDSLNGVGAWVDAHRDDIHNVFKRLGDITGWVGDKLGKLPAVFNTVKTFGGNAVDWLASTWDKVTNAVGRASDKVKSVVDTIKTKVGSIATELQKKFESIFGDDGWFARQFKKLGDLVDKLRDVLGLGPATASAASTPTNTGPSVAPGGGLRGTVGGKLGPGGTLQSGGGGLGSSPFDMTLGPGGNQPFSLGPQAGRSGYMGDSAVLSRVSPGSYVSQPGVGDLTKGIGDCTSAIEDLVAIIEGQPTAGRSLATGNADQWLAEHGFAPTDKPVPGAFQVGFFNDPNAPGGGHMQATLPDGTKINWGSDAAAANKGVGDSGAWDDPRFNKHYYKKYAPGGGVNGPGSATSDSVPAMLSNGEHVLTAADVKAMGGQQGVYAFRSALQAGLIPGFDIGGAVDPNQIQDMQNNLADLNNQALVAQQQFNETMQNNDATDAEKLQAQINLGQALRAAGQASSAFPIAAAGGTPPDLSQQNAILDANDQLALAQQRLKDMPADSPLSQQTATNYAVTKAERDRAQAISAYQNPGGDKNYMDQFIRTMGFMPASAASNSVAGTSSLSKVIDMGASIVGGLIDTGTSLANTAVSAAITAGAAAGTFGGAAPAAPAASAAAGYGINMLGNLGKITANYWYGLAGIGADALIEQLFPLGAPRWLGYDYTSFAPQLNVASAATSTLEAMGNDAISKYFSGQQNPNFSIPKAPNSGPNTDASGPSAGGSMSMPAPAPNPAQSTTVGGAPATDTSGQIQIPLIDPYNPNGAGGAGGGGSWAKGGAIGIYDNGGVLMPGQLALNASRTPENILTKQQWNAMAAAASSSPSSQGPLVQNLYAADMQDALRQLQKVQQRNMMQYAGRS